MAHHLDNVDNSAVYSHTSAESLLKILQKYKKINAIGLRIKVYI